MIQALDRPQPSLPTKKARGQTMTHDFKRHGTTTLFAALDVATRKVISSCLPKSRLSELLKFLKTVDSNVSAGLEIHLILDNNANHKRSNFNAWLAKNPRFHVHFRPQAGGAHSRTPSSWLNLVERWFRELTDKSLRRGIFESVPI